MKKSSSFIFRKIHKYFGIIIGIQFLFWTIGGIYFSWSNLDQIHSDPYKSAPVKLNNSITLRSPQEFIDKLSRDHDYFEITDIELLNIRGNPTYRIGIKENNNTGVKYFLANSTTGQIRPPLSREESIALAYDAFKPDAPVKSVEYFKGGDIGRHHEYRGNALPAYAVSFDHPANVTIYVSPEMAQVITYRNSNWRIFDFLWMVHTMDYSDRDNFNNWLLRIMAVLALITILSGFVLFFKLKKKL